jgi:negative regulator of flagellin synthesis FlgM
MKIEKNSKPLPPAAIGEGMARASTEKPAENATPVSSTNVRLGQAATQLNKIESSMSSTPVVDAAKVEQIKQAISEGRFQVNSGAVADRLIQTVADLINSNSRPA